MVENQEFLTQQSIEAALKNNWEEAIKLNEEILKLDDKNIETINRLARAYFENGSLNKSKTTYKKVLKLDPFNPIATKNLKKLAAIKKSDLKKQSHNHVSPDLFLEEPGKTKIIELEDLPMGKVLAILRTGDKIELYPYYDEVRAETEDGKRLGKITGEWGKKIADAVRSGSKFSGFVKSIQLVSQAKESSLAVFIKETFRSPKLLQPFFTSVASTEFTPYVREQTLSILNKTEEENDEENLDFEVAPSKEDGTTSLESLAEQEENLNDEDEN